MYIPTTAIYMISIYKMKLQNKDYIDEQEKQLLIKQIRKFAEIIEKYTGRKVSETYLDIYNN